MKNPKSKIQNPNKIQAPKSKDASMPRRLVWSLDFGAFLGFGILDFGFAPRLTF